MATSALTLFLSYAHEDEELRVELVKHLKLLERQGILSTWSDRALTAGSEWRGQIADQLAAADIVLLLISPDFVASDYCYDVELAHALRRHNEGECAVVPVFLRDVDFSGAPFAELQGLPADAKPIATWPDRDAGFADVARGIRKLARAIADVTEGGAKFAPAAAARDDAARTRDLDRTAAYRDLFDRFAFSVPCIFEHSVEAIDAACKQILAAMLTGKVVIEAYGGERSTGLISPIRDFETELFVSTMRQLRNYIADLQKAIDHLRYHLDHPDTSRAGATNQSTSNVYHMEFLLMDLIANGVSPDFVREAIGIMDKIDSERNAINKLLNSLLSVAGLGQLPAITLSSRQLRVSADMPEYDWGHYYLRTHRELREFLGDTKEASPRPPS
jgi:hypothetical protein